MNSRSSIKLEECKVFPPIYDWILLHNTIRLSDDKFIPIYKNLEYSLYLKGGGNLLDKNIKINPSEANFVFGNVTKRIDNNNSRYDFKGYFVIISFLENKVILSNDHFGLNKFFYSVDNTFIASSNIKYILKFQKNVSLNKTAELSYLLFNYFTCGETIFKSVRYSIPATLIEIEADQRLVKSYYWKNFEQTPSKKSTEKYEKIIAEYWVEILNGYGHNPNGLTLSLTGGYDSRMILAGLLKSTKNLNAFTFGNPLSNDAINASLISKTFNIDHSIYPLDDNSKREFLENAKGLIKESSGLANILRILRLKYFKLSAKNQGDLYLGYSGSELLRGIYPDGLMTSRFYLESYANPELQESKIIDTLQSFYFSYNKEDIKGLVEIINSNKDNTRHFTHLIQTIIPLHFGEDIRWLNQQSIITRTPFIDIDFFEKLVSLGSIPLLRPSESKIRKNHFTRINNPKLPAKVINYLNYDLGHLILGKGYSPSDYLKSKYYAGLKLIIKKNFSKARLVTEYDSWYPQFLKEYLSDSTVFLDGFDKSKIIDTIPDTNETSEIDFLIPTKYLNLHLIKQELMNK